MFGKSHTEETKNKMRQSKLGKNHPMFEKALTEEHKAKISASQRNCQKVSVLDLETNTETIYNSLRGAAKALNCLVGSLSSNIKSGRKPYKGRFVLKLLD
jgi:group I intron endonuclease